MASQPTTRSQTRQNQQQTSSNTRQLKSNQASEKKNYIQANPSVNQTPRTPRTNGEDIGVTNLRPQIAIEMDPEFVECSFEHFMQAYLPFIPGKEVVDGCLERLREATADHKSNAGIPILRHFNIGTQRKESLREGFADFHKPRNTTEAKLFSLLEPIAAAIAESRVDGRELRYKFYDCHHRSIKSDIGGSKNKIDACFPPVECALPKSGVTESDASDTNELHTSIIPVVCEWKLRKSKKEKARNNSQVVSANVQIMNADARRMFSFGVTIEEDELRLWYFSRSHSAVSEAVNFAQNPAFLVNTFISFMFATEEEMGYDPTVTQHDDNQYTYGIPPKQSGGKTRFFRTIKIISEYRSNNVTGRKARVWLVREVESNAKDAIVTGPEYVLKDVWLEESALTEQQIQNDIFQSIEGFWACSPEKEAMQGIWDKHRKLVTSGGYKDFFLTIVADYEGRRSKLLPGDFTRRRGLLLTNDPYGTWDATPASTPTPTPANSKTTSNTRTLDAVSTPSTSKPATKANIRPSCSTDHTVPIMPKVRDYPRDYARKKQYRLIFEEQCVPVGELPKLRDVVQVLHQTLTPLELLLCAGWVHRDISSGNILAYRQQDGSWRAKVSDLEYAKKFPPDPQATKAPSADPKTGTPYFMAHEILDLKYLYFLLVQTNMDSVDLDLDVATAQTITILAASVDVVDRIPHKPSYSYSLEVFSNAISLSRKRGDAFTRPIQDVLEQNLKPSVASFAASLEVMRRHLVKAYKDREEANLTQDPSSYLQIFHNVHRILERLNTQIPTWADEDLFSRREVERQLRAVAQIAQGESSGTGVGSRPGRAKRRLAESQHPHSNLRSRNANSGTGTTPAAEDSVSIAEGSSRSAKRTRTRR
ncbi:hypothetical protein D9613_001475 [Agrocybe pediades]|uniref:Protein kinase domain-containing protein n=1 Tax=Agrocybe pediades TaxID=84607 RepID=A0A8H4R5F2_9AGAR|nr:hypothetical protein D9613_001475 [Agrocybe pediades]